jgi:hypothetical protein
MAWKRTVTGVIAVAFAGTLTACGSGGGAAAGGTGLDAALSRVADNSNMRSFISYDDTAALVKLGGKAFKPAGFSALIGHGTGNLVDFFQILPTEAGISLLDEKYAISAGLPPASVGLLAGGQNAAAVSSKLTAQGWKRKGQLLVMLPLNLSNKLDGETTGVLSQVQTTGSDLVYGLPQANLSMAGSPSGQTLAQDPLIGALANCLGDVVAADITAKYPFGAQPPTAVAVGVSRPASNSAVPHGVVCVAWPSSASASQYSAALRKALSSGYSVRSRQRWSAILHKASVTTIGGSQNVVQLQAQTPQNVLTVFDMLVSADLPGLPAGLR